MLTIFMRALLLYCRGNFYEDDGEAADWPDAAL